MSTDTEEQLLLDRVPDDTIITISTSSNDNAMDTTGDHESITEDETPPATISTDDNGGENGKGVAGSVGCEKVAGVSSGDINSEDLEDFEEGMKNLDVTGEDGGPKSDSGKHGTTMPVPVKVVVKDGLSQLFETCSMIQLQQKSDFPVKPPKSCLMDTATVSLSV